MVIAVDNAGDVYHVSEYWGGVKPLVRMTGGSADGAIVRHIDTGVSDPVCAILSHPKDARCMWLVYTGGAVACVTHTHHEYLLRPVVAGGAVGAHQPRNHYRTIQHCQTVVLGTTDAYAWSCGYLYTIPRFCEQMQSRVDAIAAAPGSGAFSVAPAMRPADLAPVKDVLPKELGIVACLAFDRPRSLLYLCTKQGTVAVWDPALPNAKARVILRLEPHKLSCVAVEESTGILFVASLNGCCIIAIDPVSQVHEVVAGTAFITLKSPVKRPDHIALLGDGYSLNLRRSRRIAYEQRNSVAFVTAYLSRVPDAIDARDRPMRSLDDDMRDMLRQLQVSDGEPSGGGEIVAVRCQDGGVIHAHKRILASRIDYFKTLLNTQVGQRDSDPADQTHGPSVVVDEPLALVSALVSFAYSGVLTHTDNSMDMALLLLADRWCCPAAVAVAAERLALSVSHTNVAEFLVLAERLYLLSLRNTCLRYLVANYKPSLRDQVIDALAATHPKCAVALLAEIMDQRDSSKAVP